MQVPMSSYLVEIKPQIQELIRLLEREFELCQRALHRCQRYDLPRQHASDHRHRLSLL